MIFYGDNLLSKFRLVVADAFGNLSLSTSRRIITAKTQGQGLVPKHIARQHKQQAKQKELNEVNKIKPKKVLEKEKREEGLSKTIGAENKGFAMLQKMGFKPGMTLGKKGN